MTRVVPQAAERSTYVLITGATLALIVWQWRALPDPIWTVVSAAPRLALRTLSLLGFALVMGSTFLTSHLDLMGVRQVWQYARGRPYTPVPFVERSLYRRVRHPMMLGMLVWIWVTPAMTVGHLVFALGLTAYIAIGLVYEERGLARTLGAPYEDYRARVPALLPLRRR